jgi:hydroxymethylbilane synthase
VIVPIRGNVDTRLGRVASGELDAVVLAHAGLRRIGRAGEVTEVLDPLQLLPAAGQGALAIECRSDDDATRALLGALDDAWTNAAVIAERAVLAGLEAGCNLPIGVLAEVAEGDDEPEIYVRGSVTALDGSDAVRLSATGSLLDADGIGRRLAADLIEAGAEMIMESSS